MAYVLKNLAVSLFFVSAIALSVSACGRTINSNEYHSAAVGEVAHTYKGTIDSARQVTVTEHERLQENQAGIVGGALAGGVLGHQVGKGKGNVAATVAGALAGGAAGAYAERALGTQQGYEYTVRLEDGRYLTVVQGLDNRFNIGQKVKVIVSHKGRSRIVAD